MPSWKEKWQWLMSRGISDHSSTHTDLVRAETGEARNHNTKRRGQRPEMRRQGHRARIRDPRVGRDRILKRGRYSAGV